MHAGRPHLLAVDQPAGLAVLAPARTARVSMKRRVGAVVRLGQAEGGAHSAGQQPVVVALVLLGRGELLEHQDERDCCRRSSARSAGRCAGPGPWPPGARGSPPSRGASRPLPPVFLRARRSESGRPRRRGSRASREQRLPFLARQAAVVEVGARPFAAVVEEADVVVGALRSGLISASMKASSRPGSRSARAGDRSPCPRSMARLFLRRFIVPRLGGTPPADGREIG